jgi:hypothetical protein
LGGLVGWLEGPLQGVVGALALLIDELGADVVVVGDLANGQPGQSLEGQLEALLSGEGSGGAVVGWSGG